MTKLYLSKSHECIYILALFLSTVFSKYSFAQPDLSLTPVITSGLNTPIQFVNAADGSNRVFIVQQGGSIRAYDADFNFLSTFLTVSDVNSNGGEQGLLSMVFHPQYQTNGFFYVYYDNSNGDLELARYKVSGNVNVADASSKVILKTIPHPTNTNHNGGELHFGNDGFLYLSTGDGGGAGDVPNNAQNTSVLLGKILRFNVNTSNTAPYYTIPAGNPFGNEVYALGLRNPFRWSFDRNTFDMWIGDVGQDSWEEVDYLAQGKPPGSNFGWHCYEGNTTYNTSGCGPSSNYVFPAHTYPTQNPSASVVGGVVYRGAAYAAMKGYYVGADFYSGIFYKIAPNGSGGWSVSTQTISPSGLGIADFGETEDGEIYAVSLTQNAVYRIIANIVVPVTLAEFNGRIEDGRSVLNWRTTTEQSLRQFQIEYSKDGTVFEYLGMVPAQNASTGYRYNFLDNLNRDGIIYYRLKMINLDGSYQYSEVVRLSLKNDMSALIVPNVINDGIIHLNLSSTNYVFLDIISMDGKLVLKENIGGRIGNIQVPIGKVDPGIYTVRLKGNSDIFLQKIMVR